MVEKVLSQTGMREHVAFMKHRSGLLKQVDRRCVVLRMRAQTQ